MRSTIKTILQEQTQLKKLMTFSNVIFRKFPDIDFFIIHQAFGNDRFWYLNLTTVTSGESAGFFEDVEINFPVNDYFSFKFKNIEVRKMIIQANSYDDIINRYESSKNMYYGPYFMAFKDGKTSSRDLGIILDKM